MVGWSGVEVRWVAVSTRGLVGVQSESQIRVSETEFM